MRRIIFIPPETGGIFYRTNSPFTQRSHEKGSRDNVPCGCRAEPAKSPPQKQTEGLRTYRFAVRRRQPQNNPSVMLRMTAPFTQRSLGKATLHFLLYTKEPLLSLPFLLKGRWHKVPEGISHRFIRFIEGKRVSTAQYIVGLAFSSGHLPRRSARKPAGRQAKPVCQARPAASPLPQKSPMDIFGDTPV